MMLVTMMMAIASPNPAVLDRPRKAYAACIRAHESQSRSSKMDASAYGVSLKSACPAEAAAFTKALTDYDIAMGTKRTQAQANAANDVADYQLTSEERYRDLMPTAKTTATVSSDAATMTAPRAASAAQKVEAAAPQ